MFIALLKFSDNKHNAGMFMEGHNAWIQHGFDDGIFIVSGALQPKLGGAVIGYNIAREAFEAKVAEDPFVANNVVVAEIIEIAAGKTDERLEFLLGAA